MHTTCTASHWGPTEILQGRMPFAMVDDDDLVYTHDFQTRDVRLISCAYMQDIAQEDFFLS